MNVSLTPELEKFVEEAVASGRFRSASEVVRHALRQTEEEERWRGYARAKISRGLEDLAAGRVVSADEAIKRLRATASGKKKTTSSQ